MSTQQRPYVPGSVADAQAEMIRQSGNDPNAWFIVALNQLDSDSHTLYCFALARLRRLGWDILYRRPRGRTALDPRPIFAQMVEASASGDYAAASRAGTLLRSTGWTVLRVEPREDAGPCE